MRHAAPVELSARKAALKGLAARSDRRGLTQLAGHAALLAATGALVLSTRGTWLLAPALLAHGIAYIHHQLRVTKPRRCLVSAAEGHVRRMLARLLQQP